MLPFRPHGRLEWVLSKLPGLTWGMIGGVATEERSLAAYSAAKTYIDPTKTRFLRLRDPHPDDQDLIEKLWDLRTLQAGIPGDTVVDLELLTPAAQLLEALAPASCATNLIIDISVLPKRSFFLAVKKALSNHFVENLIVTYSVPESYSPDVMASNPLPWKALPGFDTDLGDNTEGRSVVLGVGFLPIGLSDILNKVSDLNVLFPFPPVITGSSRNWTFLQHLSDTFDGMPKPIRVGGFDVPEIFDILKIIGRNGDARCLLVPYGPKPMSLAMCLYASISNLAGKETTAVYYAQPQTYSPDYSRGILVEDDKPVIHAYPIKIKGKLLYEI